jgi:hypothetical protein
MPIEADNILSALDRCCEQFTFPMLDNGYVYLAATRLSLYRSLEDWAMVIEVFGFSPRSTLPSNCIYTFASRLHMRDAPDGYKSREAYERYLVSNPHNDSRFIEPIGEGAWQDAENQEFISESAREIPVRGLMQRIPLPEEYSRRNITLEEPPHVHTFELCRLLAETSRDEILGTAQERRTSVLPELRQILQLEEWHHPDVVDPTALPSKSETFQQLAQVLATGNVNLYKPSQIPNTDWRNWPDGGTL